MARSPEFMEEMGLLVRLCLASADAPHGAGVPVAMLVCLAHYWAAVVEASADGDWTKAEAAVVLDVLEELGEFFLAMKADGESLAPGVGEA